MSEACCSDSSRRAGLVSCPVCGFQSKPVDWLTVAALVTVEVPPRQQVWLCRDPDCELVYFGSAGCRLGRRDLGIDPGFKNGSDGLVCYCFHHRSSDIERELAETGDTQVLEAIRAQVQAGNCACEVRNPGGKCCLGDVGRTVARLRTSAGCEIED